MFGSEIPYGTVKYVIDSIEDNSEIPADPQEEQTPPTSTSVVATRSKAKAKPQLRELVGTSFIFEIIIHKYRIGQMIDGKLVWLQEEDPKEDISIALVIWEQLSISELFKDILEAISLILLYRTTC